MTLPLTHETLAAAYDFLRTTPPFNKWNLPEPEDVTFKVSKAHIYGWHDKKRGRKKKHVIAVSSRMNGHTMTLIETMAHEMVHLHEQQTGASRGYGDHGAVFKKFTEQVCRRHGFDPKRF